MRLKHVKGASETLDMSPYVIQNPETWRGHYNEIFQNNHPIYIEIGMGKGNFIIENAKRYPEINFIGIEKYDSVMIRAVQKLEDIALPNLRFIRYDAAKIEELFDHEIEMIYLNFSDPWPKERHARRRLTSEEFLNHYDVIFKDTKRIIQKTDNRKLFEYSLQSFVAHGYNLIDLSLNLHEDNPMDNIETEYEQKFIARGYVIYRVEVTK